MSAPTNERIWYAELDVMLTAASALKAAYLRRCAVLDDADERAELSRRILAIEAITLAANETDRADLQARTQTLTDKLDEFTQKYGS